MKTRVTALALGLFVAFSSLVYVSCNKNESDTIAAEGTSDDLIAIATDSSKTGDSTFIVHQCGRDLTRDSIAEASLPAATTTYLSENYSGYTFQNAFSVSDSTSTITGYVVVITYNDEPVGLEFNADGEFLKVLEKRRGRHRR